MANDGEPKSSQASKSATPPRQFRLPDETLADMDYLIVELALRSRADVIRFAVRKLAQEQRRKQS